METERQSKDQVIVIEQNKPKSPVKKSSKTDSNAQKSRGKVSIKYEIFKFHTHIIKNIALSKNNILAISSGNYGENVKLMTVKINKLSLEFEQLQLHRSISVRHNIIQWSPNGKYLAVGGSHLYIWKWQDDQIEMLKQYSDDFYEIYAFAWSPNSEKFAVSCINNAKSLIVRDINQEAKIKQIKNIGTILGLEWDPFDKHLACLLSNNHIQFYSCTTWQCLHSVNISLIVKRTIVSKNHPFKIDWSPDFRYVVSPAIDDKHVPYVVALDRNKSFTFRGTFMGPFSTVNCVKFNPHLFQLPNKHIVSIFAMGDSQGNITLWCIGQKYVSKKPLLFLRSRQDSNQIIQKIQWSADGRAIFATTFKKYMITAIFEYESFGRVLRLEQKQKVIQSLYGSSRSTNNEFKIFRVGDVKPQVVKPIQKQVTIKPVEVKKTQYVYTSQKVITSGSKMRIVPSVLVKTSEKDAAQAQVKNISSATNIPKIVPTTITPNIIFKPIQSANTKLALQTTQIQAPKPIIINKLIVQQILVLSPLNNKQSSYRISHLKHIQIETKHHQQIISILYQNSQNNQIQTLSTITIPGRINYVQFTNKVLVVYTSQGYIYLFSQNGDALQLPMLIGQLHFIKIKDQEILTLTTNCNLQFFSLSKKTLYLNLNILELFANNIKLQNGTKIINKAIEFVDIGDNKTITIQLINKKRFFLNQQTLTWHLIPNQIFTPPLLNQCSESKYPLMNQILVKYSKSFFQTMIKPPNISSLQQYQYNLIFFSKHNINQQKYSISLFNYIKQLIKLKMDEKFRQVIISHFVETTSPNYISNPNKELINNIKTLNHPIVNELISLNLMN